MVCLTLPLYIRACEDMLCSKLKCKTKRYVKNFHMCFSKPDLVLLYDEFIFVSM